MNSVIDLVYDGLRVDGEGGVDFSDCGAGELTGGNIGACEAEGCKSLDVSGIQVRKVDAEDERGMSIVDSEIDAELIIVISAVGDEAAAEGKGGVEGEGAELDREIIVGLGVCIDQAGGDAEEEFKGLVEVGYSFEGDADLDGVSSVRGVGWRSRGEDGFSFVVLQGSEGEAELSIVE